LRLRWWKETLVERKLAACAQISSIESYYTWQGTLPAIIAFDSDHVYEPYADWVADAVSNNNS
jgi:uncharacterized protein involved in tolerance to divalent cations